MNPQHRKETPEVFASAVTEVPFSLGWQQLQRQSHGCDYHLDVLEAGQVATVEEDECLEQEPLPAEVECGASCVNWEPVALSALPEPANFLDKGTKKALARLEDSLQALFASRFAGLPQLDVSQPCLAEANNLATFCARTGSWRLSA